MNQNDKVNKKSTLVLNN